MNKLRKERNERFLDFIWISVCGCPNTEIVWLFQDEIRVYHHTSTFIRPFLMSKYYVIVACLSPKFDNVCYTSKVHTEAEHCNYVLICCNFRLIFATSTSQLQLHGSPSSFFISHFPHCWRQLPLATRKSGTFIWSWTNSSSNSKLYFSLWT